MTEDRREELEEDLPEMARHTSERERRAADAERELVQWKKVRFMADKVGDEFEGYITGVTAFGLFIELVEHFVEGLVHISTMADDYYRFVERAHILRGENTGKEYRLGDKVAVQVVKVDMERRQVDLGLVDILEAVRASEAEPRTPPEQRGAAAAAPGGRPDRHGAGDTVPIKDKGRRTSRRRARRASSGLAAASGPPGKAGDRSHEERSRTRPAAGRRVPRPDAADRRSAGRRGGDDAGRSGRAPPGGRR